MHISQNDSRYMLYADVLTEKNNEELLDLIKDKMGRFMKSVIYSNNPDQPHWRQSNVLYPRDFSDIYGVMKEIILERYAEVCTAFGMEVFDINREIEMQLTAHNHGDFYKVHQDNSSVKTAKRTFTFVYYFHSIPKVFTGGELILYPQNAEPILIEPLNNTLVFFNSSVRHEVKPIDCPGMEFENGRFTLNGWVWKK